MEKKTISVFDFDGTITSKDTFIEFIKFVKGKSCLYFGFLMFTPILVAFKLHLYPNWKAKEKIFKYFFKGTAYNDFAKYGEDFADVAEKFIRTETFDKIEYHKNASHSIYVVSASIYEWVAPWCKKHGIENVIATRIEVDDKGFITGNFSTHNCYGKEKVNRFLEIEPKRNEYFLFVYGDSKGDNDLMELADKSELI